jgi:hypothetical protein
LLGENGHPPPSAAGFLAFPDHARHCRCCQASALASLSPAGQRDEHPRWTVQVPGRTVVLLTARPCWLHTVPAAGDQPHRAGGRREWRGRGRRREKNLSSRWWGRYEVREVRGGEGRGGGKPKEANPSAGPAPGASDPEPCRQDGRPYCAQLVRSPRASPRRRAR